MRHKMLVPLQLLARSGPPSGTAAAGDMYFDVVEKSIQVFDGIQWGGVKGGGGVDEVYIDPGTPSEDDVELWVDTDDDGSSVAGLYLPLVGGELSGALVVDPDPAVSPGIDVAAGGIRIGGLQIQDDAFAVTKAYCDANHGGGNVGLNTLFTATFGNSVDKVFDITHNLATENIVFSIWSVNGKDSIEASLRIVDYNNVRVMLAAPPPANGYKIVIVAASTAGSGGSTGSGGLDQAAADTRYVNAAGDTMTGNLTLSSHKVTAASVEASGAVKASTMTVTGKVTAASVEAGGGMTANGQVLNVADPTEDLSAANKRYVDSRIWTGTQAQYDAKVAANTIDPEILYCVIGA